MSEPLHQGLDGNLRASIKPGMIVLVVTKQDQATGRVTQGVVKDILTKSRLHPRGIKGRLENGIIGRVKHILDHNSDP